MKLLHRLYWQSSVRSVSEDRLAMVHGCKRCPRVSTALRKSREDIVATCNVWEVMVWALHSTSTYQQCTLYGIRHKIDAIPALLELIFWLQNSSYAQKVFQENPKRRGIRCKQWLDQVVVVVYSMRRSLGFALEALGSHWNTLNRGMITWIRNYELPGKRGSEDMVFTLHSFSFSCTISSDLPLLSPLDTAPSHPKWSKIVGRPRLPLGLTQVLHHRPCEWMEWCEPAPMSLRLEPHLLRNIPSCLQSHL